MAKTSNIQEDVLKHLLKDLSKKHSVTSLAEDIKVTRMGIWKVIKNLESEKKVILEPIGKGKTSAYVITLNLENPLVKKILATLLTEDALKQKRWISDFKELENQVSFLILYGSILHSPKEAKDIDILTLISNEKNFINIDKNLLKIQEEQLKKIHAINLTRKELEQELKDKNGAYFDALKKGIILLGQENFINFIENIRR